MRPIEREARREHEARRARDVDVDVKKSYPPFHQRFFQNVCGG